MMYGIVAVVCASLLFSITPSAQKYVLLSGISADCMVFYQEMFMFFWATAGMIRKKENPVIGIRPAVKQIALGAAGIGLTNFFYGHALKTLPVSTVVLLHFLYPLMVLILMAVLFKKKPGKIGCIAGIASIIGMVLVSGATGIQNVAGMGFALLSGLCYASFIVSNDENAGMGYDLSVRLFHMTLGAFLVTFALLAIRGGFEISHRLEVNLTMFFVLGLGTCSGFYLISKGVGMIGADKAAFLNMLEPVGTTIVGVIVYKEAITGKGLAGCVLILTGALLISLDKPAQEKPYISEKSQDNKDERRSQNV